MDLRSQILKEQSKANAQEIANWINDDGEKFNLLVRLFLEDEYRVVQRAAWIISLVADQHPELLATHLNSMVQKMGEPNLPTAVRRNVVRILQEVEIPEPLQGGVMEKCFEFLSDPKEAVAVRVFSMTVLAKLSKIYPEIKQELKLVIEEGLTQKPTAAFKSRAKHTLKSL